MEGPEFQEKVKGWHLEKPELDHRYTLNRLCYECISVFNTLLPAPATRHGLTGISLVILDLSRSSTILWSDSHGITKGAFDDIIAQSKILRQVFRLFISITNTLSHRFIPALKLSDSVESDQLQGSIQQASNQFHQDQDDANTYESDSDESTLPVGCDLGNILDDLGLNSKYLLKLDSLIRAPPLDVKLNHKDQNAVCHANDRNPFLSFLCDRFPQASDQLTERLAPLPAEAKRGIPFECLACGRKVLHAHNPGWKYVGSLI
ncbi:hypothetical protein FZEAL_3848 [Fusarium zealandicum]|uniref:Uncharacterized protein n=1 Tax=Fusarium zealandicum TaxID=1053134 RepID=A0A8H4XM59_9HYPO|nr:hypothetical protein FZEAL_3848 [Fusarium zealandicum]